MLWTPGPVVVLDRPQIEFDKVRRRKLLHGQEIRPPVGVPDDFVAAAGVLIANDDEHLGELGQHATQGTLPSRLLRHP